VAVWTRLLASNHLPSGPDSVSWKINKEIVVVAGWGRAILLQLAHPAIAAGVRDHSAYRSSLRTRVQRLRSTVRAMQSFTFGTAEQMVDAAAGINAIHDRVRGAQVDGATRAYSAHDPELQRWVHATLLASIPLAYERLVGPLTDAERQRFFEEAAIMEPLLGMPAGWLPRTTAELDACLQTHLHNGTLRVTDTSRKVARAILFPPGWQLAWPLMRPVQLLTIGLLPADIRQAYGFTWRPRDERSLARWTRAIRTTRRLLPPVAREWQAARQHGGPRRAHP
jgi:uncharacterized protein (DUF2236 family)